MQSGVHNYSLKIKKGSWAYLVYIALLYVLGLAVWPHLNAEEFQTYHYIIDIDGPKLIVSILVSLTIWYVINKRYADLDSFSDQVIMILILFYFLPGIVISGLVNYEWGYIVEYIIYLIALLVFNNVISMPKKEIRLFTRQSSIFIRIAILVVALLYPFVLIRVFGKSLSIAELILTFNDPYGVRNASKEMTVSWVIIAIEYWASYFSFVMITYYIRRKKYWLAALFVICGLFYFILQGNRIFPFFIVIAIVLGIFNLNKDVTKYAFLGVVGVQVLEYLMLGNNSLGIFTNVFRRFSIVPNMISTSYFDYFQHLPKDWLRGTYTNLFGLLGMESPYGYDINYVIGQRYYGFRMYANNGMFGGAFFEFGSLGIIIDTAMLVVALRIFEIIFKRSDNNYKFIFAVIFGTLAINTPVIWSGCFKFSYILMILLTFLLFFNRPDDSREVRPEVRNTNIN